MQDDNQLKRVGRRAVRSPQKRVSKERRQTKDTQVVNLEDRQSKQEKSRIRKDQSRTGQIDSQRTESGT